MEKRKDGPIERPMLEINPGSDEEKYNTALANMKTHLLNYENQMAAVGTKSRNRAINEMGCVSDCYAQAVEVAKNMKIPQPERQVMHNFINFLQQLEISPDDHKILKEDIKQMFDLAGTEEKLDFEKTYADMTEACQSLGGVFWSMLHLKTISPELRELLQQSYGSLKEAYHAFGVRQGKPHMIIKSNSLINLVVGLKQIAEKKDFWKAFDVMHDKIREQEEKAPEQKPITLLSEEDMEKLFKSSIDLLNYFSLDDFVIKGKKRH